MACVTGAASGIGRAIADAFLSGGTKLFAVDIRYAGGALAEEKRDSKEGAAWYAYGADLRRLEDARKALLECERVFGRLDVLVNCAGVEMSGTVVDLSEESYNKVMDTNVKSIFLTCKYAIPLILRSTDSGSIINVASDLGIQPIPSVDAYAASKGAIIALTKAMSKNWARQGLRINCIAPGPVDTPLLKRFQDEKVLDFVKQYMIPAGRLGQPEEIANVACFLSSDLSSFINGAVLTANGGLLG